MFEQPWRHLILFRSLPGCRFTKKLRTITRYDLDAGNKLCHSIITFLYAPACPAGMGEGAVCDCVMRERCTRNRNDARYCYPATLPSAFGRRQQKRERISRGDLLTFESFVYLRKSCVLLNNSTDPSFSRAGIWMTEVNVSC